MSITADHTNSIRFSWLRKAWRVTKSRLIGKSRKYRARVFVAFFIAFMVMCHISLSNIVEPDKMSPAVLAYLRGETLDNHFNKETLRWHQEFAVENEDVYVFLHIQKTGGSRFESNILSNTVMDSHYACFCPSKDGERCHCRNSKGDSWLYTRRTTNWACGVHADWTQLHRCVPGYFNKNEGKRSRTYKYITMIRDPILRYVSEWKHVQRGATWPGATITCYEKMTPCYNGSLWKGVTLEEFMNCPFNQANNRQAKMIASLGDIGCDNLTAMSREAKERTILQSAKANILKMTFYGFTEQQIDAQEMMELVFKFRFRRSWKQTKSNIAQRSILRELSDEQRMKIARLNKLDIEVYQFAKDLFYQRLRTLRNEAKYAWED